MKRAARLVGSALQLVAILGLVGPTLSIAADATSIELQSRDFDVLLDRQSQTLVSLKPKGGGGFDFSPSKLRGRRSGDGYYHLGDVDLRVRTVGDSTWHDYSTAFQR